MHYEEICTIKFEYCSKDSIEDVLKAIKKQGFVIEDDNPFGVGRKTYYIFKKCENS